MIIRLISVCSVTCLVACGGGDTSNSTTTLPGTPGGSSLFAAAELPATSELNGLFSWTRDTRTLFNDANQRALMAPTVASGYYEGSMLARKGSASEFIHGDIGITFDFTTGSGTGEVSAMSISGNDTQDRQISIFETLNVLVTDINGAQFTGAISGTAAEDTAVVNPIFDSYTVTADLDGRFVTGGVFDGMVGTVDGIVISTIGGTQSLEGVFVGEENPFGP